MSLSRKSTSGVDEPVELDVWEDREVRFDVHAKLLELNKGEHVIERLDDVEDTKGNNGQRGMLTITNLRLIWVSRRRKTTNLSVGYGCVISINIKTAKSRLRGEAHALFVQAKSSDSRFEFIFTNVVHDSPHLFTVVQSVFRAYDTSRLYRDMRLRIAMLFDGELKLLPREVTYRRIGGVWNMSGDEGSYGSLYISNIRLVWHSASADAFNVSVPFLVFAKVRLKERKTNPVLVLSTTSRAGGYVLGFRMENTSQMDEVVQELRSLWQHFQMKPDLGVQYEMEHHSPEQTSADKLQAHAVGTSSTAAIPSAAEDAVDTEGEHDTEGSDAFAAYYADQSARSADREVVYSNEIGLAVEAPPNNASLASLWSMRRAEQLSSSPEEQREFDDVTYDKLLQMDGDKLYKLREYMRYEGIESTASAAERRLEELGYSLSANPAKPPNDVCASDTRAFARDLECWQQQMKQTEAELAAAKERRSSSYAASASSAAPPRSSAAVTPYSSAASASDCSAKKESSSHIEEKRSDATSASKLATGTYYEQWDKLARDLEEKDEASSANEAEKEREKLSGKRNNAHTPGSTQAAARNTTFSSTASESASAHGVDEEWIRSMTTAERQWRSQREKEKGNEAFKASEYVAAVEAYTISLRLDPKNETVHTNRAAAYLKLKRWEDAETDCSAALALDANNWKARMRRAAARLEQGSEASIRGALPDADSALNTKPDSNDLLSLRKRCEKALADIEDRKGMKRVAVTNIEEEEEDDDGDKEEKEEASEVKVLESASGARLSEQEPQEGKAVDAAQFHGTHESEGYSTGPTSTIRCSGDSVEAHAAHGPSSTTHVSHETNWETLKAQANASFKANNLRRAVQLYDEALNIATSANSVASLYGNRSAAKLALGNAEGAEADATRAIEEAQEAGIKALKGLYRRSIARKRQNKPLEALEDVQQIFAEQPSDSTAKALETELREKIKDTENTPANLTDGTALHQGRSASQYIPKREGKIVLEEEEIDNAEEPHCPQKKQRRNINPASPEPQTSTPSEDNQQLSSRPTDELKEEGNSAFKHGRLEHADVYFTQCIEKCKAIGDEKTQEMALANRSLVRMKRQMLEDALADANAAVALNPENVKAVFRKGKALRLLEREDDAFVALERAHKLVPTSKEVAEQLRAARANCRKKAGKKIAVEKDDNHLEQVRAEVNEQHGGTKVPVEEATDTEIGPRGASQEPGGIVTADDEKERGNALMRTGRTDEAIGAYTRAIAALSSSSESEAPLANRAEANLKMERYEQAREDAQAAIQLNESNAKAQWRLAKAQEALGDIEGAAFSAQQAANQMPHNQTVQEVSHRLNRAAHQMRSNLGEGAAQKVAAEEPEKPNTQAEFDIAARKLDDQPERLAQYVLKLEPDEYPRIFKESITGTDVAHLTMAMHDGLMVHDSGAQKVAKILQGVLQVPRIGVVALLLSKDKKAKISEVLKWLEAFAECRDIVQRARSVFRVSNTY